MSYREIIDVMLDEAGNLVWITETDGQEERYTKAPGSSFKAGFIRMLPVKGQL